jgi:hypothetical protein
MLLEFYNREFGAGGFDWRVRAAEERGSMRRPCS